MTGSILGQSVTGQAPAANTGTPPALFGCIWVDLATGRLCGGQIAPGGLLLCSNHRRAAERGDWRAP